MILEQLWEEGGKALIDMQKDGDIQPCTAKACLLTSVHPWNDTRIFHKECRTLLAAGFEVVLVAPGDKDQVVEGVQLRAVPRARSRPHRMTSVAWQVYQRALSEKADFYHFHDPELIPVGLMLKRAGKRVVYDVHEDLPRQVLTKGWIPTALRRAVGAAAEVVENAAARRFDTIIAATPHIGDRFCRNGARCQVVCNYPRLDELFVEQVDWSAKQRCVAYVGGITRIRGIFQMVEAIAKTDVRLSLAGTFSSAEERRLGMRMPGWKQVDELGQLGRGEVRAVLSKAVAGLVLFHRAPNHVNALPNKLFEYMSAAIPVIASDFPLWKDLVEGCGAGFCVNPLDVDGIAEAIQWLSDHPREAECMGRRARRAVEERFSWETEARKLTNVYHELQA